MLKKFKILVITPVLHINFFNDEIVKLGEVEFKENIKINLFKKIISEYDIIFTNPNKSKIFLGSENLKSAKNLKIICTASTGTNHIDLEYCNKNNIKVLSLKKEYNIIKKISSTAELAFTLTLASIRHVLESVHHVKKGGWDYTHFIGRQMNELSIGIVGYGRLGKIYANYCLAFNSKVYVYDPFIKKINNKKINHVSNINDLLVNSDIISLHIHADKKNKEFINKKILSKVKKNVHIINTSRGDIINEKDLINFLKRNKNTRYCTDVLTNEFIDHKKNLIYNFAKINKQIIITPHIGGMTNEAQKLAYLGSLTNLRKLIKK